MSRADGTLPAVVAPVTGCQPNKGSDTLEPFLSMPRITDLVFENARDELNRIGIATLTSFWLALWTAFSFYAQDGDSALTPPDLSQ